MAKVKAFSTKVPDLYAGVVPQFDTREGRIHDAVREVESVIYGIWTFDSLIKIGFTTDLVKRLGTQGVNRDNWDEKLLFLVSGSWAEEQAIHRLLRPNVARGREYYHPTPEIIAFVNQMRAKFEITPLAA